MQDRSICPFCKQKKVSSKSGSLTQWLNVCTCGLSSGSETITVKFCLKCGLRVNEGRSGSFTQYIFRPDYCKCEVPEIKERVESVPVELPETDSTESYDHLLDENLALDNEAFPIERYKPLKQLGSGGSGKVILAEDKLLRKLVAIKILNIIEPKQIIAFQEEARATSKLSHPGIVSLMDFGVMEETIPYMVLSYIPGSSIDEVVRLEGRMNFGYAKQILLELSDAIDAAHKQGILHRDIKPSNVLVSKSEDATDSLDVHIIDFGVAKFSAEKESETDTELFGAPFYMTPEQAQGKRYEVSSEVYSLGCVFYFLLTGSPPFVGDTPVETLRMHKEEKIPKVSSNVDNVPQELDDFLLRALAKRPEDRFQSVKEFQEELDAIEYDTSETLEEKLEPKTRSNQPQLLFNKSYLIPSMILCIIICVGVYAGFFDKPEVSRVPEERIVKEDDYKKEQSIISSIPENLLEKQLGWTGGKWEIDDNFSEDYYEAVGHKVDDEDFKELRKDKNIKRVRLTMEASATGKGLMHIRNINLIGFWTMSEHFNDEGARALTYFPNIYFLRVHSTSNLGLSSFQSFAKMRNLKSIQLRTVSGLKKGSIEALSKSKSLKVVALEFVTPFSNEDLKHLCSMPKLRHLKLNGQSSVNDSSIPYIINSKVRKLQIGLTGISDYGLAELVKAKRLKVLAAAVLAFDGKGRVDTKAFSRKKITEAGWEYFKERRPDCKLKQMNHIATMDLFSPIGK